MKTMTRWLAVAGLGLATLGQARAELLAWWPFDSAGAAPGRDASKGGRATLTFLAGAGELSEGREPGALAWDTGGSDFASRSDFPATAAFSFAAWVRREPGSAGGTGQIETIVRLGERSTAGWALYVANNGHWSAYAYGAQSRRLDSRLDAAPGKWTHLAMTFAPKSEPGAAGEVVGLFSLYVDGRLANQGEFEIGGVGGPAALMLGARYVKGSTSWPFAGQISQAAIWDEPLPPSVVAELARGASPGQVTAGSRP